MSDYEIGFILGWLSAMIGDWLAGVVYRRWVDKGGVL